MKDFQPCVQSAHPKFSARHQYAKSVCVVFTWKQRRCTEHLSLGAGSPWLTHQSAKGCRRLFHAATLRPSVLPPRQRMDNHRAKTKPRHSLPQGSQETAGRAKNQESTHCREHRHPLRQPKRWETQHPTGKQHAAPASRPQEGQTSHISLKTHQVTEEEGNLGDI